MDLKKVLSIVIPLYNEEGSVEKLYHEVLNVIENDFFNFAYEIVFVNDGSIDNTQIKLLEIKKNNNNVVVINFLRNYGQSIALDAGFKYVSGDVIFTLDGDGQNDPRDMKKMYDKMISDGFDVVVGWRKKRKDGMRIRIITKCARFFRKIFINDKIHDSGCTLRVYKKECIKDLHLWGEMHRYIVDILKIRGYKVGEIVVNHRKRVYGNSKYTRKKSVKGFIDLLYIRFIAKYQSRPLHLFGGIGLLTFFVGIVSFFFSIYEKIYQGLSLNRNGFFLLGVFLIQTGIMIFIFGIVIDMLIRTYYNVGEEKRYIVKEVLE